jgi:hypothetical protein
VIAADVNTGDEAALEAVKEELADLVTAAAAEQGWRLEGPVMIAFGVNVGSIASVTIDTGFQAGDLPAWAVLAGTDDRSRHPVRPNRAILGRSRTADVRIEADSISRTHALLWREAGRMWLTDLGSANGTFVNGEQIVDTVEVMAADVLTLAQTSFVLRTA